MKKKTVIALAAAATLLVISTGCGETKKAEAPAAGDMTAAQLAFRDAAIEAPPGWTGPKFKLSHDYPTERPTCEAPWMNRKVSFTDPNPKWNAEWQAYVSDIVEYVFAGQNPDLPNETGWQSAVNGSTRWYHVPWMAYDGHGGREFVHGLTNELSTSSGTFHGPGRNTALHKLPMMLKAANGVDPLFETWSVGFYNPCGAYSVGQGWPKSGEPATTTDASGRMFANGMPFGAGTVVVKILNTTADEKSVPYLKNSTTWQCDAHKQLSPTKYSECEREVRNVHIVQMDLAVIDERSPTRWVYSTLSYDGRNKGKTVKDRLLPLGVQWGNDQQAVSALPNNVPLKETIIAGVKLPEHYGCQKRLAGVVDQANSSCVSCHMGSFSAAPGVLQKQGTNVPPVFNFADMCIKDTPDNQHYFSDYKYPQPFPGGQYDKAIPLDSSLQLQVAFAQYAIYKNPTEPTACPNPGRKPVPPATKQ